MFDYTKKRKIKEVDYKPIYNTGSVSIEAWDSRLALLPKVKIKLDEWTHVRGEINPSISKGNATMWVPKQKAPSSSPLLCCRSHPPFVAASDRSSSLTYTDEINSTATERDAPERDQRQPNRK